MDVTSFHKLRTAVQDNAVPAGSLEVLELESGLRGELEESGYFDQVEVGSTSDPDQLVIALCRCAPDVPAWEAAYRLEHVWDVLRAGSAYFRPYRPTRDDNPLAFHFFLALYFCGGLALLVWGILALVGGAPPMPLR